MKNKMDLKEHWERVYQTKTPDQVSWTQLKPEESLNLIQTIAIGKSDAIIDIGGGDSLLVDFLLAEGYTNITVLDISGEALNRAKKRLGTNARKVKWIESNIIDFIPTDSFDIWHDRAAFHFLTSKEDITSYSQIVKNYVYRNLILGVFSTEGPLKCSGIEISQYDAEKLASVFNSDFLLKECFTVDHLTPFDTKQNFLFCSFTRK